MKKNILIHLVMVAATLLSAPFALAQSTANANILIVVNAKTNASSLTTRDVSDLYLGRTRNLPNGQSIVAIDHPSASAVRARFYKALTGKAITDINAYWARLLFTGQSSPPQHLSDGEAVIESLKGNPGLIGYVEQSQLPNPDSMGLKVLLTIPAP